MAAADKPKVYYFDGPGRAEIARQMLTYLVRNSMTSSFIGMSG